MGITFSSKMFPIPFNVEVSLFVVSYILLRFFVTSSTWGCGEWFCETPDPLDPSRRAKSPPFDRTPVYVIFHTSPPYDKRANLSLQLFNKIGHGISEVAQQPTVHRSMLSGCAKNLEPKNRWKHSFDKSYKMHFYAQLFVLCRCRSHHVPNTNCQGLQAVAPLKV